MIRASIGGIDLQFETEPSLFSPREIDAGTLVMLSRIAFATGDKVLDLGCGYGAVGIYAASRVGASNVWLLDKDPVAVEHARRNLELNGAEEATVVLSDGFHSLAETGFAKILCNPPYHVDFSVPKHMIEKGFNRLAIGGSLWMVTRRDDWYRNKLRQIFGGVRVEAMDGYFVFEAVKTSASYAQGPRSRNARPPRGRASR